MSDQKVSVPLNMRAPSRAARAARMMADELARVLSAADESWPASGPKSKRAAICGDPATGWRGSEGAGPGDKRVDGNRREGRRGRYVSRFVQVTEQNEWQQ